MFGFHGRYLRIHLTTSSTTLESVPEHVLRRFLGGVGLAAWLAHQEAPAGVDPLSPLAPLIFAFSALVGTPLTTSAKFAVAAKSPLTERFNDALASSHFALAGKKCGADAFVIVGASARPAGLCVDDGRCDMLQADDLWGLNIDEAMARLEQMLGPEFHTAIIGTAGERCVRFATISHERRHAGRGGLGAVMGAKNLKAVAVRG